MLKFLGTHYGGRKLRLLACACCRRVWDYLPGKMSQHAVEVAERFADGQVSERELDEAGDAVEAPDDPNWSNPAAFATWRKPLKGAEEAAAWAVGFAARSVKTKLDWEALFSRERARQAELLREIAGNPFQAVGMPSGLLAWENGTIARMAQSIYETNRFGDLPILADALEDAGCSDAEILSHCRVATEHVRGCWMIDAILAKE